MKIVFFLFYLNSAAFDNSVYFDNESDCFLDSGEKKQLILIADDLKESTGIIVLYLCRKKKLDDWSRYKNRLIIYLDKKPEARSIKSTQKVLYLRQTYLDQLSLQFLQQSETIDQLIGGVSFLCEDIKNFWLSEELIKQKYKEENEEEMSPEFWAVIKIYVVFLLIYGVWVILKWKNKATNKAEYWEHYGYSRFPVVLRYSLWVIVFAAYFSFLYNFVYYYAEIFILLIPLGFLMRPSVMLASAMISMVMDWKRDVREDPNLVKASLGQKRFMLNPKSGTEDLILLDLLELVIGDRVQISYQLKNSRYGTDLYYKFLSVGPNRKYEGASSFQQKMMHHLSQGKNYYVLDKLIADLIAEIGSFKAIRKDYLLKDLVRMNYVSKKSWVMNRFKLTPEGIEYVQKLSPFVRKMESVLTEVMIGQSALGRIKKEILLINGYEKKIEDLYNHLVKHGRYEERMDTEVSPLLEQTFSFYEFKSAIQHQINKIHRSYMVDEESQKGDY